MNSLGNLYRKWVKVGRVLQASWQMKEMCCREPCKDVQSLWHTQDLFWNLVSFWRTQRHFSSERETERLGRFQRNLRYLKDWLKSCPFFGNRVPGNPKGVCNMEDRWQVIVIGMMGVSQKPFDGDLMTTKSSTHLEMGWMPWAHRISTQMSAGVPWEFCTLVGSESPLLTPFP